MEKSTVKAVWFNWCPWRSGFPRIIFCHLDRVLDLSFISEFLSPAYQPTHGREGFVPALAMRMILVGYLYDLSEVRLCEEVGLRAGYRWFCRLYFHDPEPDRPPPVLQHLTQTPSPHPTPFRRSQTIPWTEQSPLPGPRQNERAGRPHHPRAKPEKAGAISQ